MGEKIRDLKEINIGKVKLMVELNEGYTASQGRVIHIQNNRFRYLLKENDFLHLCSEVIRANDELKYLKSHPVKDSKKISTNIIHTGTMSDSLKSFTNLLESHNIDYRIVEEGSGYNTIIINPSSRGLFKDFIKNQSNDIKQLEHPYGELFDYKFLYKMKRFELYKYKNELFEIYYQLPCMSTTAKTWIPLDSAIQKRIWAHNDNKYLDEISYYIYRLCWAIFKDNSFSTSTIKVLEKNTNLINSEELKEYLKPVFFGYTETLLNLLNNKEYENIIESYYTFIDY